MVLLNNSPQPQTVNLREINWPVKMPRQVRDLLSDERFKLGELVVPAYGVRILA